MTASVLPLQTLIFNCVRIVSKSLESLINRQF
nr:MAG TPA: hypothetical protein [Caudoviricetes sp.]